MLCSCWYVRSQIGIRNNFHFSCFFRSREILVQLFLSYIYICAFNQREWSEKYRLHDPFITRKINRFAQVNIAQRWVHDENHRSNWSDSLFFFIFMLGKAMLSTEMCWIKFWKIRGSKKFKHFFYSFFFHQYQHTVYHLNGCLFANGKLTFTYLDNGSMISRTSTANNDSKATNNLCFFFLFSLYSVSSSARHMNESNPKMRKRQPFTKSHKSSETSQW